MSDSEDPQFDQQLGESVSFINISLSSFDDSVDNLLKPVDDIIQSGAVIESKIHTGSIKSKTNLEFPLH